MEKRGLSHIEVILSFFIFVSFVLFAIYFFSPSKTSRIVDSSLSYTLDEVKKNISVELESFSVILNSSTQGDDLASVEIKGVADNTDNKIVINLTSTKGNMGRATTVVHDPNLDFSLFLTRMIPLMITQMARII